MLSRAAWFSLFLTCLSISAGNAQEESVSSDPGMYFGLSVGTHLLYDASAESTSAGVSNQEIDYDSGAAFDITLGGKVNEGLRVEGEIFYTDNDVSSIRTTGNPGSGETTSLGVVLSAVFDFKEIGGFNPFIGLGAGIAEIDSTLNSATSVLTGSNSELLYQIQIGADYSLSDDLDLFFVSKYRMSSDYQLTQSDNGSIFDYEFQGSTMSIGLRQWF
ncbi:MAG: outer membrane beta-barrel protein [Candidatus Poseidoniales archaeon]